MTTEQYYIPMIERELDKIRRAAPDADTVRRKYRENHEQYVENVTDGRGGKANGNAIAAYYIARQAYALYAIDRGISLEVG